MTMLSKANYEHYRAGPFNRMQWGIGHSSWVLAQRPSLGIILNPYGEPETGRGHRAGLAGEPRRHHVLLLQGPDENVVELQIDNFKSREETDIFRADGRFAINPVGIDIEPEALLARRKSGESDEVLTRWPDVVEPRTSPPPKTYLG